MFMPRYDSRSLAGRQGLRCLLVECMEIICEQLVCHFEFNIFLYIEHNIHNEYKVILY